MAALHGCPSASCTAANQHQSPDSKLLSHVPKLGNAWLLMHWLSDAASPQLFDLWLFDVGVLQQSVRKPLLGGQVKCATKIFALCRNLTITAPVLEHSVVR